MTGMIFSLVVPEQTFSRVERALMRFQFTKTGGKPTLTSLKVIPWHFSIPVVLSSTHRQWF